MKLQKLIIEMPKQYLCFLFHYKDDFFKIKTIIICFDNFCFSSNKIENKKLIILIEL